jgi:hypothetical protein
MDPNAEGAPTTPVQAPSLARDESYNLGVAGVGLGKTAVGMLQLAATAHQQPDMSKVSPAAQAYVQNQYNGLDPMLTANAQALPAKLQSAQAMLSGVQQSLINKESPGFQAAANAPLNPLKPNSVFTHPLVQAALAKGTGPLVDLLATLVPVGFMGLVVRGSGLAALAATGGGMSAGQTMSAVADTVNNTPDAKLQQLLPAYAAARKKGMTQDAARAQVTTQLGDTQALWQGVVGAALADVGGASVVGALGKDIGRMGLAARVGTEAGVLGGVGAGSGAASSLGQQQATAPVTGKPTNWRLVLHDALVLGLESVGFGGIVGAISRHAPETMAPGTKEQIKSPEGQAVNHATHADAGTVPGAEVSPPIDYDELGRQEDDEEAPPKAQSAQPQEPVAPPVDEAHRAAVEAAQPAAPAAAVAPPVERAPVPGTLSLPGPKDVAPLAEPPVTPGAFVEASPKPFVMPETNDERVPVAQPVQLAVANRQVMSTARKMVMADPRISKTDQGLVDNIMADIMRQAHDELPYHEGSAADMVAQFAAAKPLRQRIAEAVTAARQVRVEDQARADDTPEAYGPEAKDETETPAQVRARDPDLFKPGNEGKLLKSINPDEDARSTYRRAAAIVKEQGDNAHESYHDLLGLSTEGRGGDVRAKSMALAAARARELAYLQAHAGEARVPTEADILNREHPELREETPQEFWGRVERAHAAAADAGVKLTRGSFLYRARKLLDDARDKDQGSENLTGRRPIPNRKLTDQMRGEEFEARHPEIEKPLASKFNTGEPVKVSDKAVAESVRTLPKSTQVTNLHDELQQIIDEANKSGDAEYKNMARVAKAVQNLGLKVPVFSADGVGASKHLEGNLGFYQPVHSDSTPHGSIVLNNRAHYDELDRQGTVLHEAVHAATYRGLREDPAFHARVSALNDYVRSAMRQDPAAFTSMHEYATTNADEFVAHALSHPEFQRALLKIKVPIHLQIKTGSRLADAWHAFVGAVRGLLGLSRDSDNALTSAMTAGKRAMRTGDQISAIHASKSLDATNQTALVFAKSFGQDPRDIETATNDLGDKMARAISEYIKSPNAIPTMLRGARSGFLNGETLGRWGDKLFHWDAHHAVATRSKESPSQTVVEQSSEMAHRAMTLLDHHTPVLQRLGAYFAKHGADEQTRFENLVLHSTHYDYDATATPNPKGKPKTAAGIQKLEQHKAGAEMYKGLNPEGRALFKDLRQHVHDTRVATTRELVRNNIHSVFVKEHREALAAGNPPAAPIDHNEIDAMTDRYMNKQETADDKERLGPTHQYLAKQRRLANGSSNYFPERRQGNHAVVYQDLRPETHTFANEKDMQDFAKSTDLFIKSSDEKHYAANGDEIDKDDPAAPPVARSEYTVNTQNHGLEFFDSAKKAQARIAELKAHPTNKYKVSGVEHTKESQRVQDNLDPSTMNTLKAALMKSASDDKERYAFEQALNEAAINLLPGNSYRSAALRRANVMGASTDILKVLQEHFAAAASVQARLEHSPEISNAISAMHASIKDQRYAGDGLNHYRQELLNEFEKRNAIGPLNQSPNGVLSNTVRRLQQVAFVEYMATPSFNMIQAAQPWMTGMPYLGARYGGAATGMAKAAAAMAHAYGRIGGRQIMGEGGMQLYNATKNIIKSNSRTKGDYLSIIEHHMMKNASAADKPEVQKEIALVRRLADSGIVDHGAGLQMRQVLSGTEHGVVRGLKFAEEAARAIPTAVEVVNRAMLAIATRKLELAKGGNEDSAYIAARDAIKRTQGDYSPGNTPRYMMGKKYPLLAPAFTFRKYAQFIYTLIAEHAYESLAGESKEVRQVARRTLANTLFTHAMVAGAHGLPIGGILMVAAGLSALLGENQPWNYDQHIHELGHALGMDPAMIDLVANGVPSQLGFNVTKRMGLDSLVFDELPRDNKADSWLAMAADTYGGAPMEMAAALPSAVANITSGRYLKALGDVAPKIIMDPIKAINYAQNGVKDSDGNTIVAPGKIPLHELVWQAIGFEADAVEEAYSAHEAGISAKADAAQARRDALDKFKQYYGQRDFAGAMSALTAYNKTVPYADRLSWSVAAKAQAPKKGSSTVDGVTFTKKQGFLSDQMQGYNVPN